MASVECDAYYLTTMSSIGSMTTAFTPEPYCLKDLYIDDSNPNLDLNPFMDPNCLPPGFPKEATTHTLDYYYYSPAVCPSGYSSACAETCLALSLSASETGVRCCPIGYECVHGVNYCGSRITTSAEATFTNKDQKVTTVSPLWNRKAFALAVYVRHKPSDLELFASATATEGSTTGMHTAVETAPASTATDTDTDMSSDSSTGLATGAKIAIGVVVPVVVIALCLVAFFFWRKRRTKATEDMPQSSGWMKPELDNAEVDLTPQRIQAAKGPVRMPPHMYELSDTAVYPEMDGQQRQGR